MSFNRQDQSQLRGMGSRIFPRLLAVGRASGIGLLSGLIAGFLAAGVGSRLAMRIGAMVGGDSVVGLVTENGNIVGQVTVEGSVGLIVFAGGSTGMFGGLLYVAARRWLPGPRNLRGLVFGSLALAILGTTIVDANNTDFVKFGPAILNVVMFALLFVLFGVVIAPIAERLEYFFPSTTTNRRFARIVYVFLAFPALILPVAAAVGLVQEQRTLARILPLLFLSVYGLATLPTVKRPESSMFSRAPTLPATIAAHLMLILPAIVGVAMLANSIMLILGIGF